MPPCDYHRALDRIIDDFHTKEARFWNSKLEIVGIENIRETAVLPWAAQSVPRRFCSGTAVINDGARHPIYYSIAEDTGMIGWDWGTEFCVVGLEPMVIIATKAGDDRAPAGQLLGLDAVDWSVLLLDTALASLLVVLF